MTKHKPPAHRSVGIYFLPSLLTTSSLFAAFYAIVAATKGKFELAAIAIFIAMIADSLDGRVARLTNTQTDFGAEYDSLADMVAFGLAPALLAYNWTLYQSGKLGWLAAFVYTAAVAIRLARFNTQLEVTPKRYFIGLACPSAAAIVASSVWLAASNQWNNMAIAFAMAVLMVVLGILMVSQLRYASFKEIDFNGRIPYVMTILLVLIFAFISLHPPLVLFLGFGLYVISGPIAWLLRLHRQRKRRNIQESQ